MASRTRLYDQFGPFILFKRLETDSLGELWRAGRVEGDRVAQTVALRKLTAGNRAAIAATAEAAARALPMITGTYIVAGQTAGVIGGEPWLAWNYTSGRSLRQIVDRARDASSPAPLPLDQAIVIAEKIAQSLVAMAEFRDTSGQRLAHGAPIPQFVWISDEGEIRMAGQLFGSALAASARDGSMPAITRYFSPEFRNSAIPSQLSEVYALGALLFLLVTGEEPPDATSASAFANAVLGARTMTGEPVPDDIRSILRRTLTVDPATRIGSVADVKQAISALTQSGKYAATTFNLAFYLSTALSKEMSAENAEREKEASVDVKEVLAAAAAAAAAAPVERPRPATSPGAAAIPAPAPAMAGPLSVPPPSKSKAPLAIAAAVLVAAVGVGAFFMMKKDAPAPAPARPVQAAAIPVKAPVQIPQPVVATPGGDAASQTAPSGAVTGTAADAEAQKKKAFEDAVNLRLQAEMMKLQQQFTQGLKQQQSKQAPIQAETAQAAPATREDTSTMSAAALDSMQRESRVPPPAVSQPTQTPAAPETAVADTPAAAAPTAAPQVREGDVVEVSDLDQIPHPQKAVRPVYPLVAARQKMEATIILTVLVSERGEVLDVRVLRGNKAFGFEDAALRAIRQTTYTPAMKSGKRVRTWLPQTIIFKP